MTSEAGETVAGLRVLRPLRTGAERSVLLAHEADHGPRVVIVLGGEGVVTRWCREVTALERAAGAHVMTLLDTGECAGGYALVTERLPGPSLAELAAKGALRELGEVVTALAPIAGALGRMHAAGVAHGALSARQVLLDESGAPTLIGFRAAVLGAPGRPEAQLARDPGVIADRAALRRLTLDLLGECAVGATGQQTTLTAFLDRLRAVPESDPEIMRMCADELFTLASARAISLEASRPVAALRVGRPDAHAPPAEAKAPLPAAVDALTTLLPVDWRDEMSERWAQLHELSGQLGSLRDRLAGRGRLIVTGVVAAAVLGAAVLVWPTGPAPEMPAVALAPTPAPSASVPPDPVVSVAAVEDPVEAARMVLALTPDVEFRVVDQWGDSVLIEWATGEELHRALLIREPGGWVLRDMTRAAAE